MSPHRYRPSRRLFDFTAARDAVCAFITCNQPGYRCEYEHITPYPQGTTCRCNGALACRRHNQCKIDSGYSYQVNPDTSFTWTTDTGHTYTGEPTRRWTTKTDRAGDPDPAPPRQLTEQGWWAKEDTAYDALLARLHRELTTFEAAADTERATRARDMITRAHQQRHRELTHRTNPDLAPF